MTQMLSNFEHHQSELTNAMIDEDLNVLQEYKINKSITMVIASKIAPIL